MRKISCGNAGTISCLCLRSVSAGTRCGLCLCSFSDFWASILGLIFWGCEWGSLFTVLPLCQSFPMSAKRASQDDHDDCSLKKARSNRNGMDQLLRCHDAGHKAAIIERNLHTYCTWSACCVECTQRTIQERTQVDEFFNPASILSVKELFKPYVADGDTIYFHESFCFVKTDITCSICWRENPTSSLHIEDDIFMDPNNTHRAMRICLPCTIEHRAVLRPEPTMQGTFYCNLSMLPDAFLPAMAKSGVCGWICRKCKLIRKDIPDQQSIIDMHDSACFLQPPAPK